MSNDSDRRREIKRLFALREKKGLSFRDLSEKSGIPIGTLHWWSSRLRSEESDEAFVDLGVVRIGGEPVLEGSAPPEARLLLPSGIVIELRGEFADQVVNGLLHGVSSWS